MAIKNVTIANQESVNEIKQKIGNDNSDVQVSLMDKNNQEIQSLSQINTILQDITDDNGQNITLGNFLKKVHTINIQKHQQTQDIVLENQQILQDNVVIPKPFMTLLGLDATNVNSDYPYMTVNVLTNNIYGQDIYCLVNSSQNIEQQIKIFGLNVWAGNQEYQIQNNTEWNIIYRDTPTKDIYFHNGCMIVFEVQSNIQMADINQYISILHKGKYNESDQPLEIIQIFNNKFGINYFGNNNDIITIRTKGFNGFIKNIMAIVNLGTVSENNTPEIEMLASYIPPIETQTIQVPVNQIYKIQLTNKSLIYTIQCVGEDKSLMILGYQHYIQSIFDFLTNSEAKGANSGGQYNLSGLLARMSQAINTNTDEMSQQILDKLNSFTDRAVTRT